MLCFNSVQFLALRWLSTCIEQNCLIEHEKDYTLNGNINTRRIYSLTEEEDRTAVSDTVARDQSKNISKRFVCAYSSSDPQNLLNHNEQIIQELGKLAATYKNSNDQWRCFAYEKAIAAIKKYPKVIHSRKGKMNR